jgi:hypothetical protein
MIQDINKYSSKLKKKIRIGKDPRVLINAISDFEIETDSITKKSLLTLKTKIDCKKGCQHCCNLRVEVLPPEAFLIANHIKSLPNERRELLAGKLREHATYAKDKTFAEYNKACAFLGENGECQIYSARPHKCRSNISKSVQSCISTRNADEVKEIKYLHDHLTFETVNNYKSKGCVMHPTELTQGVLAALDDETLPEKWASGVQVYELLPEGIML